MSDCSVASALYYLVGTKRMPLKDISLEEQSYLMLQGTAYREAQRLTENDKS